MKKNENEQKEAEFSPLKEADNLANEKENDQSQDPKSSLIGEWGEAA